MIDPSPLSSGGILACYGSTKLRAFPGALLTDIIEKVTKGGPSHIATLLPGGSRIFESTIYQGVSGPQFNTLADLEADYQDGGKILLYRFLPEFQPHWDSWFASAQQMNLLRAQGKLCYGYWHLVRDLVARDLSGAPGAPAIERLTGSQSGVVCSEAAAIALEAGGLNIACVNSGVAWLPGSKPDAGSPIGCAPSDLIPLALPVYMPVVQIL
jgi:hypothetical protein